MLIELYLKLSFKRLKPMEIYIFTNENETNSLHIVWTVVINGRFEQFA